MTVVGAARSGLAAARLLSEAGAQVFLTDAGAVSAEAAEALGRMGVPYEAGGHTPRAQAADFFVVSPGVPTQAPLVQAALAAGAPVYSEIEAASWFCAAPIVAITGSNGKTTTTSLIAHLFAGAGRPTTTAGNIGYAFSDAVRQAPPEGVVVLEVSSFQLDFIDAFRPAVSVLLNVTPDHLDRYEHDFERYARSKARIFENQRPGDALVYNLDDAVARRLVETAPEGPRRLGFSQAEEPAEGAFVRAGLLVVRLEGREEEILEVGALALRGRHNLYNALAAALAARASGVDAETLRERLAHFEGPAHRLEFVRELDGVRYYNDSKATNVDAVWYALESFREPVVLIAGGRDKGNDYAPLRPLLQAKGRGLVALGESAEKVLAQLGDASPACARAGSMEEAVRAARLLARPGDVVLLSPACASFDMFKNYEDRGDTFKRVLAGLEGAETL